MVKVMEVYRVHKGRSLAAQGDSNTGYNSHSDPQHHNSDHQNSSDNNRMPSQSTVAALAPYAETNGTSYGTHAEAHVGDVDHNASIAGGANEPDDLSVSVRSWPPSPPSTVARSTVYPTTTPTAAGVPYAHAAVQANTADEAQSRFADTAVDGSVGRDGGGGVSNENGTVSTSTAEDGAGRTAELRAGDINAGMAAATGAAVTRPPSGLPASIAAAAGGGAAATRMLPAGSNSLSSPPSFFRQCSSPPSRSRSLRGESDAARDGGGGSRTAHPGSSPTEHDAEQPYDTRTEGGHASPRAAGAVATASAGASGVLPKDGEETEDELEKPVASTRSGRRGSVVEAAAGRDGREQKSADDPDLALAERRGLMMSQQHNDSPHGRVVAQRPRLASAAVVGARGFIPDGGVSSTEETAAIANYPAGQSEENSSAVQDNCPADSGHDYTAGGDGSGSIVRPSPQQCSSQQHSQHSQHEQQ